MSTHPSVRALCLTLLVACGARSHTRSHHDDGGDTGAGDASAPPRDWAGDCIAERGCSSPRPAPCGATTPGRSVEDVLAAHEGTVVVDGFLSRVGNVCTELGCGDGQCCNECTGTLAVTTEPRAALAYPLPPLISLSAGDASRCTGDDSGQCCGLAVGGRVQIEGTVVTDPTHVGGLRLDVTRICQP